MHMKNITQVLLTCILFAGAARAKQAGPEKAAADLIKRVLPAAAASFEVAFIPKSNDKDVFELESKNGKIVLRGNNAVSIGSALNYYLKNYAHCDISWNGSNLHLP